MKVIFASENGKCINFVFKLESLLGKIDWVKLLNRIGAIPKDAVKMINAAALNFLYIAKTIAIETQSKKLNLVKEPRTTKTRI